MVEGSEKPIGDREEQTPPEWHYKTRVAVPPVKVTRYLPGCVISHYYDIVQWISTDTIPDISMERLAEMAVGRTYMEPVSRDSLLYTYCCVLVSSPKVLSAFLLLRNDVLGENFAN